MGRARRAGVGRGARLSRVAAHHHPGAKRRAPTRATRARRCDTSSRTSRCTSGSATGRRDGSTRATRRSRRASGSATTCSRPTSRSRCAARRRSTSSSTSFERGTGRRAVRVRAQLSRRDRARVARSRARAHAASSSTGRTDVTSTPRSGRRSGSRSPGSSRSSSGRTRRRYGALAVFADLSLMFLVTSLFLLPFIRVAAPRATGVGCARCSPPTRSAERAEREAILATLLGIPAATRDVGEGRCTAAGSRRRRRAGRATGGPASVRHVETTSRKQWRGRCLTLLRGAGYTRVMAQTDTTASSTSLALVGARDRLDRAGIRRSGAGRNHHRTDFARAWLLCPRAHRDSEVAVGHGRLPQSKEVRRARPARASLAPSFAGRIAQLVRAPALHAGCRGFESLFAHGSEAARARVADPVRQVGVPFVNALEVTTVKVSHRFALTAAGVAVAMAVSATSSVAGAQVRGRGLGRTRRESSSRRSAVTSRAASSSRTRSATGSRTTSTSGS